MTVKELRDLLAEYPDETEVFVVNTRSRKLREIELAMVYDQDTAVGSLCLSPKLNLSEDVKWG